MGEERQYTTFNEHVKTLGGVATEAAVREFLVGKATQDDEFRKALVADPLGTVTAELGIRLPDGIEVEVHEETHDSLHLVLPAPMEMTPADLAQVSGGWVGANISDDDA